MALFGLVIAAVIFFIAIMAVYFIIYKMYINKAVAEKNTTPHIHMVPPFKIAIILSVIVLLVNVYLFSTLNISYGSVGVTSLPLNEYLQEINTPEISEWLKDNTNDDSKAYILKNKNISNNGTVVCYLIYVPYAADNSNITVHRSSDLSGESVILNFEATNGDRGNTAVLVTYAGSNDPKIKINYGGKKMEYTIAEVGYPLDLQ